jgi:hypothetical protein
MSAEGIATIVKMLETLPDGAQEQVCDHLREYIEDLRDEMQWDAFCANNHYAIVQAARRAKREIAEGLSEPMDFERL